VYKASTHLSASGLLIRLNAEEISVLILNITYWRIFRFLSFSFLVFSWETKESISSGSRTLYLTYTFKSGTYI
jgi:hypothetical protein